MEQALDIADDSPSVSRRKCVALLIGGAFLGQTKIDGNMDDEVLLPELVGTPLVILFFRDIAVAEFCTPSQAVGMLHVLILQKPLFRVA